MEETRTVAVGRRFLLATVFLTGMSIMGIEMSASRLLAPYFGTSLIVWTNIIGLIMVSLSVGSEARACSGGSAVTTSGRHTWCVFRSCWFVWGCLWSSRC